MRTDLILLFLVVGAANYLMRFLPLLWALRRGNEELLAEQPGRGGSLSGLLPFVGPSVVAALLMTSLLPEAEIGVAGLVHIMVALPPTLAIAVISGNLGLTVLVGVSAYWLASLLA